MGLIKAALGSAGGVLADQWKEYFYCESMPADVLITKGEKNTSKRSSNTKGSENIISNGSVIAVADGQCMIIVDQGKVAEICAEPGEFVYDTSTEPSIFCGELSKTIPEVFKNIGKRFTFGGEPPKDQRIYFVNTKELIGNKYGTPSPVPFRVVDTNVGLDVDISLRCFGEYSYRITNPILFYTNVCGNVDTEYTRDEIDSQLKSELLTALQPAFAKISDLGIRYSAIPAHTMELADALNEVLSKKWAELRGIEIVSLGVSSVKASEEDEQMIKELQRNAAFRNPNMAAAHMVGAQAEAMQNAALNEGGMGAMGGFFGMGMAQQAGGIDASKLFAMGAQQQNMQQGQAASGQPGQPQQAQASAGATWKCSCGAENKEGSKFCSECGTPKPVPAGEWTCSCGAVNKGKFCSECGAPKPASEEWTCSCGAVNKGKFCAECGAPRP